MMFSLLWKMSWNHETGQTGKRHFSCKLYDANSCNEGKYSALATTFSAFSSMSNTAFSFFPFQIPSGPERGKLPSSSPLCLISTINICGRALANMDVTETPPAAPDTRHPIEEIRSMISCPGPRCCLIYLRLTDRFRRTAPSWESFQTSVA